MPYKIKRAAAENSPHHVGPPHSHRLQIGIFYQADTGSQEEKPAGSIEPVKKYG
jgi:hypothetical protein